MEGALYMGGGLVLLLLGYRFYGTFVASRLGVGELQATPAHTMRDGVDYVPARRAILMGHHFASIAGAAPIIGPVLAAQFGWAPVFVWIIIGAVFMGAVHDFTSLVASVRHEGRSIGMIIERYLGRTGKLLFLLFAWSALILVIAVFTLVVARTFVTSPEVATASMLFILLAVAFGVAIYRLKVNFVIGSVVGVVLLGVCLYLGVLFPFPRLFPVEGDGDPMLQFWHVALLVYVFIASVLPVNILLQPRDYLNSFLLYAVVGLSVIAVFVAPPAIRGDAFIGLEVDKVGPIFPMLFVTVACGAISGFHSMVASGTTAKQLNREEDAKAVGYGSMLIESALALLALLTAVVVSRQEYSSLLLASGKANPVNVFSSGVAGFLSALGVPSHLGKGFAALAVSAFALTSLDTATRLARFSVQELAMKTGQTADRQNLLVRNRYVATGLTVGLAALLLLSGSTMTIWRIFGSANQLLAALALMAVTVWLSARKRKSLFTFIPMVFMYIVTVSALVLQLIEFARERPVNVTLLAVVVVLLVLALLLAYNYLRHRFAGSREDADRAVGQAGQIRT